MTDFGKSSGGFGWREGGWRVGIFWGFRERGGEIENGVMVGGNEGLGGWIRGGRWIAGPALLVRRPMFGRFV